MNSLKYWNPEGFEISSYEYSLKERANQIHTTLGSDKSEKCKYSYNELGFRGDSPTKNGFKIMSIGCSHTQGVGVNDNETWPRQFTNLIPNGVDLNFGCGARSNDYISRCLLSYYDAIKPDLVLIMYTNPARREIYTKDGGIEPFMPPHSLDYLKDTDDGKTIQKYLTELQNDNEDLINWYKNHQLIKLFLESKKCNWLWNGSFRIPTEYKEFNRFDGDYHNFLDFAKDGLHPGPIHNYEYSRRLFNYICVNFREYLDKDLKIKKNFI
jgi:hypothetical protein